MRFFSRRRFLKQAAAAATAVVAVPAVVQANDDGIEWVGPEFVFPTAPRKGVAGPIPVHVSEYDPSTGIATLRRPLSEAPKAGTPVVIIG